jgi:hypothetical protein
LDQWVLLSFNTFCHNVKKTVVLSNFFFLDSEDSVSSKKFWEG